MEGRFVMALTPMRCVPIRATLLSRGEEGLSERMTAHVDGCERCQQELAAHRTMLADLAALEPEAFSAPAETTSRVMAEIGPWAVPEPSRSRSKAKIAAAAAVATAATAAAAGTAIVFRVYRHRTV